MQLSKCAELVGIVAVVVSLGLLTWELNQANRLSRFTVSAEIGRHYNEMNLDLASSREFGELAAMLADDEAALSEVQRQQAISYAYWYTNVWKSAERGYEYGWIPRDQFQATLNDIEATMGLLPGLKPHFKYVMSAMEPGRKLTEVERRIVAVAEGA